MGCRFDVSRRNLMANWASIIGIVSRLISFTYAGAGFFKAFKGTIKRSLMDGIH